VFSAKMSVYKYPYIQVLSESDRKQIYRGALEILQRTGIKIEHKEALNMLSDAGANIDDNIAYIPPNLIEKGLSNAPETILIYDRSGNLSMRLGGRNNYFGTGSDTPKTLTLDGKDKKTTRKDVEKAGIVVDALENIDFIMSMGLIQDEPVNVSDLYQFREMLYNTTKPIVFTSHDKRGNEDIVQMASIAVGGKEKLGQNPFIIHYIEPTTPLSHSKEAIDKLIYHAEKKIPMIYTPAPSAGATGPMTFAGTLALSVAESLGGIALAQLINPGAPVITGGVCSLLDMKTSSYLYGAPETALMHAALSEMSQFMDLPMYGTAGCSDSKIPDGQAALEAMFSITTQILSGANLIHDIGYLESGMTSSLEQIVMSNEIIEMVKRLGRGVDTEELHQAADLIDEVGPKGNFLSQKDTVEKFKTEIWEPELIDRSNIDDWEKTGAKTMGERVNEKAQAILDKHSPKHLAKDKTAEIDRLIKAERKDREVRY